VGIGTGVDQIAEYARELGLGKATGIVLGGEAPGLVPSSAWKKKARGEPWYPGETLSVAIGQGYNLVTPLQMAVMTAVLANKGTFFRPLLIRAVTDSSGAVVDPRTVPGGRRVEVSPRTMRIVREALWGVVNKPGGTGRAAAVEGLDVSGKTGTAQVVRMARESEKKKDGEVPNRFRDHAWFVCYASGGTGQVAIAIVVEHGGHGGSASAPLAKRILTEMKNLGFFQLLVKG
jgi:penicillin-binding protein 2